MPETLVLDTFAILALLNEEPGSMIVESILRRSQKGSARVLMTWVNMGEVAYIVERRWDRARFAEVLVMIEGAQVELVPVARDLALEAAHIKAAYPLAYADAYAVGLALMEQATLVTGDPELRRVADLVTIKWLGLDER